MEGSCEHGNQPSYFIERLEFPAMAQQLAAPEEGLSSMKLSQSVS
jgi:hypothetical protein